MLRPPPSSPLFPYTTLFRSRVPLRCVPARVAARPRARADPATHLLVLRTRSAYVGPLGGERPADRGRDDGGRGGTRLLRRLHRLLASLPAGGADGRNVRRSPGLVFLPMAEETPKERHNRELIEL